MLALLHDFINGMGLSRGYCVGTDPAGDQLVADVANEKGAARPDHMERISKAYVRHREVCRHQWRMDLLDQLGRFPPCG